VSVTAEVEELLPEIDEQISRLPLDQLFLDQSGTALSQFDLGGPVF
jgi:hypothetical protein